MKSVPLYPFQSRVRAFVKGKSRVGIFVHYGGGKTFLSLRWMADNLLLGIHMLPILVLCPKKLIPQWVREIKKHSNFSVLGIVGSAKERITLLQQHVEIYVINYDAIRSKPVLAALEKKNFMTVTADESTQLKHSTTKRFKKLYKLLKYVSHKAILTGRAIEEKPDDLFAQMQFLDDGATFSNAFWKFKYRYFSPGPPWKPYEWTLRPGAAEQIALLLNEKCIRVQAEEISGELPPQVLQPVYFELPAATRKLYTKLKKEFAVELPSGDKFTTQWAVVKSTKLHQMCVGFMYKNASGEAKETELLHRVKLDWIQENVPIMLEAGPVLIWSNFIFGTKLLAAIFYNTKIKARVYEGKLSHTQTEQLELDFKAGKFDVFILSQKAAYQGLDLPEAANAIFMSMGYEAGQHMNARNRNYRIGSQIHSKVHYYFLLMKKTVDEVVWEAIERKTSIGNAILKHIREK